mmetsp:Transcript_5862/g.12010  ORF Transcript_5862/g.12010 Transcript_5862/m.12010 type:complete len:100 (-) Transcript_5862:1425-1724(-)
MQEGHSFTKALECELEILQRRTVGFYFFCPSFAIMGKLASGARLAASSSFCKYPFTYRWRRCLQEQIGAAAAIILNADVGDPDSTNQSVGEIVKAKRSR